jgi:2-enoate reductase
MVGCEAAHFLADQGKSVTLLDVKDECEAAADVNFLSRMCLFDDLSKKSVKTLGLRVIRGITGEGVNAVNSEGKSEFYPADTIVVAAGSKSVESLEAKLGPMVTECHVIGDARQPRKIMNAVWEAYRCCCEL